MWMVLTRGMNACSCFDENWGKECINDSIVTVDCGHSIGSRAGDSGFEWENSGWGRENLTKIH